MPIQANQFFNPADSEYEIIGFYEEFIELETEKRTYLGYRRLDATEAPRTLGVGGSAHQTLLAPLHLTKGRKPVKVRASRKEPMHVFSMVQAICGRSKNR